MIGYYAHGHGNGHCNYAQILGYLLGSRHITIFTDSEFEFGCDVEVVILPDEQTDGTQFDRDFFVEPPALHYAPVNLTKLARRNVKLLENILHRHVHLLIVDVSVEIAMLSRISSVPYAYVRLQGNRNDTAHLNAFAGALFLLAYFPEEMEMENTPDWVRAKTLYLGFISKYLLHSEIAEKPVHYRDNGKKNLLYLQGYGGHAKFNFSSIDARYNIYMVGPVDIENEPSGALTIGVVESTMNYIKFADIIVASCGSNTTSEIISLGKSFIAIEEERYYDEHVYMASGLERNNFAKPLSRYNSLMDAIQSYDADISSERPKTDLSKVIQFCDLAVKYESCIWKMAKFKELGL